MNWSGNPPRAARGRPDLVPAAGLVAAEFEHGVLQAVHRGLFDLAFGLAGE